MNTSSSNTPEQPGRRRSTKRAAADAQRSKSTYDLPTALCSEIAAVAKTLECSQSDVAAHLLAAGLRRLKAGDIDLHALRRPHTCKLRFNYKLPPPDLTQEAA